MHCAMLLRCLFSASLVAALMSSGSARSAVLQFPAPYCEADALGVGGFSHTVHSRAEVFFSHLSGQLQLGFALLKAEMGDFRQEHALRRLAHAFFVYIELIKLHSDGLEAFVAAINRESLENWGVYVQSVLTPTFRPEVRVTLRSPLAFAWAQTFLRDLPTVYHLKNFNFRWIFIFRIAEVDGESLDAELDFDHVSIAEGNLSFGPEAVRLALRSALHPAISKNTWELWSRLVSESAYLELAQRDHAAFIFSSFLAALHPETARLSSTTYGSDFFERSAPLSTWRRLSGPSGEIEDEMKSRLKALLWLKSQKYDFGHLRGFQKNLWIKRRGSDL